MCCQAGESIYFCSLKNNACNTHIYKFNTYIEKLQLKKLKYEHGWNNEKNDLYIICIKYKHNKTCVDKLR